MELRGHHLIGGSEKEKEKRIFGRVTLTVLTRCFITQRSREIRW